MCSDHCTGLAYKIACLLGLDTESGYSCLDGLDPTTDAVAQPLKAEMARRCFWAVWFTQCINADHSSTGVCLNAKVMNLPLPMDETSFLHGLNAPSVSLSAIRGQSSTEKLPRDSILAELMAAMMFWYLDFPPPSRRQCHSDLFLGPKLAT